MDLTDKEYVERCRDGHQEDFRVLVDRYQKPLFSYLAGRVRDGQQVEEAAKIFVGNFGYVKSFHSFAPDFVNHEYKRKNTGKGA